MSYEENAKKLEQIIAKLESGEVSLQESSSLFEEGMRLAKECYTLLQEQKGKITKIKQDNTSFFEEDMK